jgi:hypothetical protein
MKITICGSIFFYEEMLKVKKELEGLGHEVDLPPSNIKDDKGNSISVSDYYKLRKAEDYTEDWIWERKSKAIRDHFEKVAWADSILVLNYEKKGIKGYVGANTLIEIGLAFFLEKPIYLYNQVPDIDYKEEIVGMKPIVIDKNLELIK